MLILNINLENITREIYRYKLKYKILNLDPNANFTN